MGDDVNISNEVKINKAARNDFLRQMIPTVLKPDKLVLTRGIAALDPETVTAIFEKVRQFDEFTPGNDPYSEHDFGAFEYSGQKLFWKIDNFGGHNGLELVLTIMLANEY